MGVSSAAGASTATCGSSGLGRGRELRRGLRCTPRARVRAAVFRGRRYAARASPVRTVVFRGCCSRPRRRRPFRVRKRVTLVGRVEGEAGGTQKAKITYETVR